MEFEVRHTEKYGEKRVIGYIDKREIIEVGITDDGRKLVLSSSCIPTNIKEAKIMIDCYKATMDEFYKEYVNK